MKSNVVKEGHQGWKTELDDLRDSLWTSLLTFDLSCNSGHGFTLHSTQKYVACLFESLLNAVSQTYCTNVLRTPRDRSFSVCRYFKRVNLIVIMCGKWEDHKDGSWGVSIKPLPQLREPAKGQWSERNRGGERDIKCSNQNEKWSSGYFKQELIYHKNEWISSWVSGVQ